MDTKVLEALEIWNSRNSIINDRLRTQLNNQVFKQDNYYDENAENPTNWIRYDGLIRPDWINGP